MNSLDTIISFLPDSRGSLLEKGNAPGWMGGPAGPDGMLACGSERGPAGPDGWHADQSWGPRDRIGGTCIGAGLESGWHGSPIGGVGATDWRAWKLDTCRAGWHADRSWGRADVADWRSWASRDADRSRPASDGWGAHRSLGIAGDTDLTQKVIARLGAHPRSCAAVQPGHDALPEVSLPHSFCFSRYACPIEILLIKCW